MNSLIPVIHLDKPVFGSPCNGCGTCCIEEVCDFGRELGDTEHCRALVAHEDGSYGCGLILHPYDFLSPARLAYWKQIDKAAGCPAGEKTLRDYYAAALGAGRGCDSSDD